MAKETATADLLVRAGLIDACAVTRAQEVQAQKPMSLGKALASLGLAEEDLVASAIAKGAQLELLGPELPEVSEEVAVLLSADFCRKKLVFPVGLHGKALRLAMVDPWTSRRFKMLNFRLIGIRSW
jgi:Type II secretion system (T2SS), protein E, N-terminal domain